MVASSIVRFLLPPLSCRLLKLVASYSLTWCGARLSSSTQEIDRLEELTTAASADTSAAASDAASLASVTIARLEERLFAANTYVDQLKSSFPLPMLPPLPPPPLPPNYPP